MKNQNRKRNRARWVLLAVALVVVIVNAPMALHEMKRASNVVRHAWGCEP